MEFNGKRYSNTGYTLLKMTANRQAKEYRKKGYLVRIVKKEEKRAPTKYYIYIRKAK